MAREELKPWERGDRMLHAYETINAAPDMAYVTDQNSNNVTRIIADLLHYCTHQNSRFAPGTPGYMVIDVVISKAQAIYNFEHDTGK